METALLIIGILCVLGLIVVIVLLQRKKNDASELSALRTEVLNGVNNSVLGMTQIIEGRLNSSEQLNEQKLDAIRLTMERNLVNLQQENDKRLKEMQAIVDEKMQKTLKNEVSQSFRLVNEQLEKVYKGLGEMQSVAVGVSDLKKVLSNVKTRGILGEIQLGAILEEMLSREQYETNVITKKGSSDRVEYAVKLPGENGDYVYLPIDAKFPGDLYSDLQDAYADGSPEKINAASAKLVARIKQEAKDIRSKYIDPPATTEFAILFLPFEGLYAEAVNRGMVEELRRNHHISLAGPSTMAALLNSLQMGFKTLAIQKRSSEVWKILGAVKAEFEQFGAILESSQSRLNKVNEELDKLIGTRTRAITRKLKDVERLESSEAERLLNE
ncbi:MAG: DNA recombination protein RmuC [Eubacteriales bacterium]|nr:DNA recombination protein RmuC [Eubacteriales bacterium]